MSIFWVRTAGGRSTLAGVASVGAGYSSCLLWFCFVEVASFAGFTNRSKVWAERGGGFWAPFTLRLIFSATHGTFVCRLSLFASRPVTGQSTSSFFDL